ncbi:uncharacterized protein SCODWIG_02816 [Saccharomycodes ludwigii]|uniref:BRCT domain-containing protein n=1 Tax=Saccharomycodes ludwigii TaxID=36035 RepID=A0A376B8R2_9ASCO|nr:uncharacterized protein SCODWIG_02816 [Saccharomycodes ludwigii]
MEDIAVDKKNETYNSENKFVDTAAYNEIRSKKDTENSDTKEIFTKDEIKVEEGQQRDLVNIEDKALPNNAETFDLTVPTLESTNDFNVSGNVTLLKQIQTPPTNSTNAVQPTDKQAIITTSVPSSSPISVEVTSSSRKAKTKAFQKLHTDIENLNAFQKQMSYSSGNSAHNKGGMTAGNKRKASDVLLLTPHEKEERDNLHKKLKSIENMLTENKIGVSGEKQYLTNGTKKNGKKIYDIKALVTGTKKDKHVSDLEIQMLQKIGIEIIDDIDTNDSSVCNKKLNAIIAPKKLRTAKFLKSFGFQPLKYCLLPQFINKVLEILERSSLPQILNGDIEQNVIIFPKPEDYFIPEMDMDLIREKTALKNHKIFERCNFINVHISQDIPGGVNTIGNILKNNGVQQVKPVTNVSNNKTKFKDLIKNIKMFETGNTGTKNRKLVMSKDADEYVPDYIFIVTKSSQAKYYSKLCRNDGNKNNKVLIVEWNWCVKAIFDLDVDYNEPEFVIIKR